MKAPTLYLTPDIVQLVAEIDEFKGRWQALENLSPERLSALRKVATDSKMFETRFDAHGYRFTLVVTHE